MVHTQYEDLLSDVLLNGDPVDDRTGVGTRSVFARQMRFDLADGFPLVTTKKVFARGVVEELLWMLSGSTNVHSMQERGVHIWDAWAGADGDLGPVYGAQWRSWPDYGGGTVDQIGRVIEAIRRDPHSRRHIVSAWNVAALDDMALPPCHLLFQFHVAGDRLSCQLYQRSADLFLGVPFNIASYALLTHMVAAQTGYRPGEFVWTGGDCHIYDNHAEQVRVQLTREPYPWPNLELAHRTSIFDYTAKDVRFDQYHHHPALRGAVAV